MILKIFYNSDVYVYKDIDSTFCITKSYGGMMSLQFDVNIQHHLYKYLREEIRIEYDNQFYLIKGVNERTSAGVCTINAELDLTGLENKIFLSKKWTTVSFYAFTQDILSGTGWSIVNAEMVSKRTTTEAQDQTPLQLLEHATNLTSYAACYEFDTKNRRIICIKPENNTTPTGCYFTDELNIKDLTFKGSSSGLVTRLYPVGKDGLTIASVNNGTPYIDDHTYSDKIIAKVWRDERYTNAQELYDDAIVKLAVMANPERSYSCKVMDLAKMYPNLYEDILSYKLYDVVTQIDRIRGKRVDHRIVETKEYPADRSLNSVTFSLIAGRVTGKLKELDNRLIELDAQQLHDRTKINEIKQDLDTTVLHISESWKSSVNESMFTQTAEGLYLKVNKLIGTDRWGTLIQQSAEDIRIAWNKISQYIKLENAQFNIYDGTDKLISFNSGGEDIYYKGQQVGRIGGTYWDAETQKRGLAFNLKSQAAFMSWGLWDNDLGFYDVKWLYTAEDLPMRSGAGKFDAGKLHATCDIDIHYNSIKNLYLSNVKVKRNGNSHTGYTGNIRVVTDVEEPIVSFDGHIVDVYVPFKWTNLHIIDGIVVGYNSNEI